MAVVMLLIVAVFYLLTRIVSRGAGLMREDAGR